MTTLSLIQLVKALAKYLIGYRLPIAVVPMFWAPNHLRFTTDHCCGPWNCFPSSTCASVFFFLVVVRNLLTDSLSLTSSSKLSSALIMNLAELRHWSLKTKILVGAVWKLPGNRLVTCSGRNHFWIVELADRISVEWAEPLMSVHDLRLTFTDDFLEFGAVCGTISGQLKKNRRWNVIQAC